MMNKQVKLVWVWTAAWVLS